MQYNYTTDEFALEPTTCPKTQGGRFYIGEAQEGKRRYEMNIVMGQGGYGLVFVPEWVQKALNAGKYVKVKIMGIKHDKQTGDYIAFLQGNAYDYPPFRWVENKVSVNMWSEKTVMYEVWVQDGPKPKYENRTIKEFAHVGKRWWVNAPEWVKNAPFFESSVRQYRMSKIIDKLNEFRAKTFYKLDKKTFDHYFDVEKNTVKITRTDWYGVTKEEYVIDHFDRKIKKQKKTLTALDAVKAVSGEIGVFDIDSVFEEVIIYEQFEKNYKVFVGREAVNSHFSVNNYAECVCDVIKYHYIPKEKYWKFFPYGRAEYIVEKNHRYK
jgi:hypothetical protein